MSNKLFKYAVKSSDSETAPGEWGDTITVDLTNIFPELNPITAVRILSVQWPLTLYNVMDKSGYSNVGMSITVPATSATANITIPDGFYDGNTLLDTIAVLFNASFGGAYSVFTTWNANTFLTTIRVEDLAGIPQIFTIDATQITPIGSSPIPSILELLGYSEVTYSGATSYISEGPLNVFIDRVALITCDEVEGINTTIDHLGAEQWLEGICAYMSFSGDVADIMRFEPYNNAPLIHFTSLGNQRVFHFNFVRERYPFFGPTKIYWTMLIELR